MTIDNELQEQTPDPRPVEELLKMDSYADMTDEEIESVIAVKTQWAANDAYMQAAADYNQTVLDNANAVHDRIAQELADMRREIQENTLNLQVVSYGTQE